LKKALKEGLADSLDIENVDGDERVVEMDVALLKVRFFFLVVLGYPNYFNADPDPAFCFNADSEPYPASHLNADPDPAPLQKDWNLQLLAHRPSMAPF
jgi:hypothetical protein